MAIKAIIWDVGGVLERTEDLQPRNALASRLGLPIRELESIIFGNDDDFRVQLGKIEMEEHQHNVAEKLDLPQNEMGNIFADFFAGDVLDRELIDTIRGLKEKYCSAIISNYAKILRKKIDTLWKINDAFHYLICSAEVGLMKPNPAIYQLTLERIGYTAQETVFIDDFLVNIEAAKNIGMHGILFKNKDQAIKNLELLLKNN